MKLKELFDTKKEPLLNIYFTAGYPELESTTEVLEALEKAGVDMVEIGIPYSDPVSDGPTIQGSNTIAIENGITVDKIFEQLSLSSTNIAKIAMAYFNSVYMYGVEAFCKNCSAYGISALIAPDLPIEIYKAKYQSIFEKHGISIIFLVSPETSEERIRYIDECSTSFIYAVSSSSTTGKGKNLNSAKAYLSRLKAMNLKSPLMVGFNISSKQDFDFVADYAAGGIIGSAFIKHITKNQKLEEAIPEFISSIRV